MMEKRDIIKFREEILNIPLNKMKDGIFIGELAKLYTSLADFFNLIRLPRNTGLKLKEKEKYSEVREKFRKKFKEEMEK